MFLLKRKKTEIKNGRKCHQARTEGGKCFCSITDYVCPFNGKYHLLEDKDGTNYICGGERNGCEVCWAYYLGEQKEKFKHAKVIIPKNIDGDTEYEVTKFLGENNIPYEHEK